MRCKRLARREEAKTLPLSRVLSALAQLQQHAVGLQAVLAVLQEEGWSEAQVRRALSKLERRGLVVVRQDARVVRYPDPTYATRDLALECEALAAKSGDPALVGAVEVLSAVVHSFAAAKGASGAWCAGAATAARRGAELVRKSAVSEELRREVAKLESVLGAIAGVDEGG